MLCLAENSVGERSTRPDDVHTMYSGKSVEINNTDAEGRLVLGKFGQKFYYFILKGSLQEIHRSSS